MTDRTPLLGGTVHYVSFGTPGGEYRSQCRAATITEVGGWLTIEAVLVGPVGGRPQRRHLTQEFHGDACALLVTNPTGLFLNDAIRHDEAAASDPALPRPFPGGTWHWPCDR